MKNATHASMVGVAFSCPSRRRIFFNEEMGAGIFAFAGWCRNGLVPLREPMPGPWNGRTLEQFVSCNGQLFVFVDGWTGRRQRICAFWQEEISHRHFSIRKDDLV